MNYYLGIAYIQMNDWDNAIEYLNRAINNPVMPYNIMAHAHAILGDLYEAIWTVLF